MTSMDITEAREKLHCLLDEMATAHEPVLITGPRSNAVLVGVGEGDWNSIQEKLHLLSVPRMRESIREGIDHTGRRVTKNQAGDLWQIVFYKAPPERCPKPLFRRASNQGRTAPRDSGA